MPDPISFLGLPLHPLTLDQAVQEVERVLDAGGRVHHVALNAAKVAALRRDDELARAVRGAGLVTADGQGVVWGARLLGAPVPERVTGIDLMDRLVERAASRGFSVYFLGARPEVVAEVARRYRSRFPGLRVAGTRDGYFTLGEDAQVADAVRRSGADLLFCGLPTPRKELFLDRWFEATGAHFAMGVGGSFDVVAGRVRRAPRLVQRAGMEWFYRFAQEPARLWRRSLVDHAVFVGVMAAALARSGAAPRGDGR